MVSGTRGLVLTATARLDATLPGYVVVPGVNGAIAADPDEVDTIPVLLARFAGSAASPLVGQAMQHPEVTVATVCGGALALAMAGLIEGRHAATHAQGMQMLDATGVQAVSARVVDDGDLISSGGVTSGLDLGLYLLERSYGPQVSHAVETLFEYDRRGTVWKQTGRRRSRSERPAAENVLRHGGEDLGMEFFCYHRDRHGSAALRDELLAEHWSYMDRYSAELIARGPTFADDGDAPTGSVHIVDLPDAAAARAFAFDEPNYQAGVYRDVLLRRWRNALGRTMWDFPGGRTGGNRYLVLGLGAGEAADLAVPPGRDELIAYGPLLSDDGATWLGTAALVRAPDQGKARAVLAPARYAEIEVHNWAFGGRP